jgi:hypothetical protein
MKGEGRRHNTEYEGWHGVQRTRRRWQVDEQVIGHRFLGLLGGRRWQADEHAVGPPIPILVNDTCVGGTC